MYKKKINLMSLMISVLFVLFGTWSCITPDDEISDEDYFVYTDIEGAVQSASITIDASYVSASISATVDIRPSMVKSIKMQYRASSGSVWKDITGGSQNDNVYTVSIGNLELNTSYYVRLAVVSIDGSTYYSEEKHFTTLSETVSISKWEIVQNSSTGALDISIILNKLELTGIESGRIVVYPSNQDESSNNAKTVTAVYESGTFKASVKLDSSISTSWRAVFYIKSTSGIEYRSTTTINLN